MIKMFDEEKKTEEEETPVEEAPEEAVKDEPIEVAHQEEELEPVEEVIPPSSCTLAISSTRAFSFIFIFDGVLQYNVSCISRAG